ncbi:MAG: efflux RND transporter periplasmic adaptor subunit [Blastocatellales bacterium]|nr:efflux RND transporter periplasmic adaptor subunit [Blastocatellales bacterium]
MPITEENDKEKSDASPTSDETAVEPMLPEADVEPTIDAAQPAAAQVENEAAVGRPRRSRRILWSLIVLLIAVLAVAGYLQRERVRRFFATRDAAQTAGKKILYWVDPMHPAYKSDKPGTAPDCGMDLVPVYEEAAQTGVNLPPGTIQISPERQQLIGVQYGEAAQRYVSRTLRAVGRLAYDETGITHVHTKYEGWIEEVFVDFTGKLVAKGQPLVSIYSPELLQTQQEFLLARRGRIELAGSPYREASFGIGALYEAARKRLELWDLTEAQIQELERSGKPVRALPIYAPNGGFVTARNAFQRQRVTPETELYTISDLSRVWVIADIYEFEAPEIVLGQAAAVTLAYFPGRVYHGRVTYIYPQVDAATRTLKARIEIPNADFALKPDMYANVELKIDYGRHVVVPEEAVMDSGADQTVFVAREGGYFEPRRVRLGAKVDREYIVLAGLKAGERIVTSANFLIDSESRLKSAAGGMGMPGMSHDGGQNGQSKTVLEPAPPPKKEDHSQHKAAPVRRVEDHSQHQSPVKPTPTPTPKKPDHSHHEHEEEDRR